MRALCFVVLLTTVASTANAETEAPAEGDKATVDITWIAPRAKKPKGPAHEVKQAKVGERVLSETTYAYGVKHGPYKSWYDNGQVHEEGQFEDGLKAGAWTRYNKNGNVAKRWSYKLGLVHGVSTIYSSTDSEQVVSKRTFMLGREHGPAEEYYGGPLSGRGEVRNGQKHGAWTYFHRDGKVRNTVHYTCGRKSPAESPGVTPGTPAACPAMKIALPSPEFVTGRDADVRLRKTRWEIAVKLLLRTVCGAANAQVMFNGKERACQKIYFRTGNSVGGTRG